MTNQDEVHKCCDGECNHDDCCGKIPENCPLRNQDEVKEELKKEFIGKKSDIEFVSNYEATGQVEWEVIADWWLSKFDTLLAKKREEAENLKYKDEWKEGEGGSVNSYEFNRGVDAVIKILS